MIKVAREPCPRQFEPFKLTLEVTTIEDSNTIYWLLCHAENDEKHRRIASPEASTNAIRSLISSLKQLLGTKGS